MEPASTAPRGRLGAVIVAVLAFVGMVLLLNRRHDRDSRPQSTPSPRRRHSDPDATSDPHHPSRPRAPAPDHRSTASPDHAPPDPPTPTPSDTNGPSADEPGPTRGDIARYALGTVSMFVGAALLWLVLWGLVPVAAPGWSPHAISSGSMAPVIQRGDLVITEPPSADEPLGPPAVVAFTDPTHGDHVLHRIVETTDDGALITRGDANGIPDSTPLEPDRVTGVGRLVVPLVGLPAVWLGEGRIVPVAATATLLLLLAWASRFALFNRHDPWLRAAARSPQPAPPELSGSASHNGSEKRSGPSTTNSAVVALITLFSLIVATGPVEAVTSGGFTATTGTQATWSTGEWAETTTYYLKTNVEGDTATELILPMSEDEPTQTDLPNYSMNLDDRPGRFIYREGEGLDDEDDSEDAQVWLLQADEETILHGELSLTIWAEIAGGASHEMAGELTATAFVCESDDCDTLGVTVSDDPWGDAPGFVEKTVVFGDVAHTLAEGDVLVVLVQVSENSGDDMSLAYDTVDHPSRIEIEAAPPPATPDNLTVTDTGSASVDLTWDAGDDADFYRVRHRQEGTGTWTETDAIDDTSTTVGGLASETTYEFQVRAEHLSATSSWSDTVTATTTATPPHPVWHTTDQKTADGTSPAVTVESPDNVSDGDLVLLIVSSQRHATVNWPDGFTQIRTQNAGNNQPRISAAWRIADGEPTDYEFSLSANHNWHALATRVTGHDPDDPVGAHSGTTGTGNAATIPGIDTTRDDVLLVAALVNRGAVDEFIPPSEMTQVAERTEGSSGGNNGQPAAAAAIEVFETEGPTGGRTYGWDGTTEGHAALMFEILPAPAPPPPPGTPEGLTVDGTTSSSVDLAWDPVDDADPYRVRHRQDGTATWTETDAIDGTSTTVEGLASETTYEFQVRAENAGGTSDWSAAVIATTVPHDPLWWDDSYGYRAQLTVTTGGTAPVNRYEDYTVRAGVDTAALIDVDRLRSDCEDLRVLRWSGDAWTELHRDIDDCGTTETEVWFALAADIADSASDDSYWLYFDEPSADPGPADRNQVYLFHDDFEGHALGEVPAGWTVQSGGPWRVVDDNGDRVLRREGGAADTHLIQVDSVSERDVHIETRMRAAAGAGDLAMCAATRMTGLEHYAGCMVRSDGTGYNLLLSRTTDGGDLLGGNVANFANQTWYRVGFATFGSTLQMWRDGTPVPPATNNDIPSTAAVGLRVDAGDDDTDFDDVIVRRYTDPEPTVEVGAHDPF